MPEEFTEAERREWRYIVENLDKMQTLAVSDQYVIACLAKAAAEERELTVILRKLGRTYEGTTTTGGAARKVIRPRPEVAMLKTARAEIYRGSVLLGLDPSSRTRLNVGPPTSLSDDEAAAYDLLTPPPRPWEAAP